MGKVWNCQVKLKYKFATQNVGAGVVAVAIGEDALKYSDILRMNSAGAFILKQLQDEITYAELTERMFQKYDADKATIDHILVDFLSMLSGKDLLLDNKGNLVNERVLRESRNQI